MKFLWILVGLALTIDATFSVPVEMETTEVPSIEEENTEQNNNFVVEVRTQLEEQKNKSATERNTCTRQTSGGNISNGDTIALQTFVRNYWLSGYRNSWSRQSWPHMQMTGTDWTVLWGEVFRIYRASGPGQVRVGDLVGVYYPPLSGIWMGCTGSTCPRSSCPGQPTTAHGFATKENWYTCCSAVFKIYASGKANGDVINSGDDIMLYNLDLGRWVAQAGNNVFTTTTTCAGTTRPPPADKFDLCYKETFTIWKGP